MKGKFQWVAVAIVLFGTVLLSRQFWPRTVEVVHPPRIRTVYDTVTRLDTAFVTRIVERTKWDTVYLERVTMTPPETLYVTPDMFGLTLLDVGQSIGDSTVARGFHIFDVDGFPALQSWQLQWWTAGPLKSLSLDTFPPRIAFLPPSPVQKRCDFWCQAKLAALAGGVGLAVGYLVPR